MHLSLTYQISKDRRTLTIFADEAARKEILEEFSEEIQSDKALGEAFETLLANSELDWVRPEETGDLTDAPILGILSGETTPENKGPYGAREVGRWDNKTQYSPILERWVYLDYAVKSPLKELAEKGKTLFQGN